jgi:uncharacterized membrane protein HdeD (DUF308 family)
MAVSPPRPTGSIRAVSDPLPLDDMPFEPKTVVVGGRQQRLKDLATPLVLRGVLAIVVGLVALVWPSGWSLAITMIVGAATFLFGMGELLEAGRRHRRRSSWGFEAFRGFGMAAVGLFLMVYTQIAFSLVAIVIGAAWAGWGAIEIGEAVAQGRAGRSGHGEHERRIRLVRGVAALGAGIAAAAWPDISARLLAMLIGGMLVFVGVLLVLAGRQLRKAGELQPVLRVEVLTG